MITRRLPQILVLLPTTDGDSFIYSDSSDTYRNNLSAHVGNSASVIQLPEILVDVKQREPSRSR